MSIRKDKGHFNKAVQSAFNIKNLSVEETQNEKLSNCNWNILKVKSSNRRHHITYEDSLIR